MKYLTNFSSSHSPDDPSCREKGLKKCSVPYPSKFRHKIDVAITDQTKGGPERLCEVCFCVAVFVGGLLPPIGTKQ